MAKSDLPELKRLRATCNSRILRILNIILLVCFGAAAYFFALRVTPEDAPGLPIEKRLEAVFIFTMAACGFVLFLSMYLITKFFRLILAAKEPNGPSSTDHPL